MRAGCRLGFGVVGEMEVIMTDVGGLFFLRYCKLKFITRFGIFLILCNNSSVCLTPKTISIKLQNKTTYFWVWKSTISMWFVGLHLSETSTASFTLLSISVLSISHCYYCVVVIKVSSGSLSVWLNRFMLLCFHRKLPLTVKVNLAPITQNKFTYCVETVDLRVTEHNKVFYLYHFVQSNHCCRLLILHNICLYCGTNIKWDKQ